MKAPSRSPAVRAALCALCVVLSAFVTRTASAQFEPRYAVDRFEPAERGSEWLANESLDLRGHLRPSVGFVLSYAHRSVVVPGLGPEPAYAPVESLAYAHLGASVVIFERARVAMNLPFQVYAGGDVRPSPSIPAPSRDDGVGDLRLGADVRVFGDPRGAVGGALGAQLWMPTGQRSQWASDGAVRFRPRVALAGEAGIFVWAAQAAFYARDRSELSGSGAAGLRIARTLVVGPEVIAATVLESKFTAAGTPIELLLGAHWLVQGTARVGGGVGAGVGEGFGAPAWRAVFGIEWAPELASDREDAEAARARARSRRVRPKQEPDADLDDVPDAVDACPRVVGVATTDPRTNGCPPDTDEDGVDDLADACPTVRGLVTTDPETNGCPDRDRDKDGIANDVDACPDDRGASDIDPRRHGCPRAFVRGSHIELLDQVEMKPGGEIVENAENEALLTTILSVVLKVPAGSKVRIEGHTDNRGDVAALKKQGAARAASLAKWLVERGIERSRIVTEGVGPDRPRSTNETDAGRAENRRLELHLDP